MTPVQMRSFHAVAKTGSFSRAAALLHVSQPTITTQVRSLEEFYGVELLHRTQGRGAHLSEAGRTLYSITQLATATIDEATAFLKEAGGLRAGRLCIAAVGVIQMARILPRFCKQYPFVELKVVFGNSKQVEDALLNYQADIGLLGEFHDFQSFHTQLYTRPEIVIVVSRRHPWRKRRSIRIEELAGQPMIMREPGSETRRVLEQATRKANVALSSVMEIGSREGMVAAVADGIGIGVVSEEEIPPNNNLHTVHVSNAAMTTRVDIACLKERRSARLLEAFFSAAMESR